MVFHSVTKSKQRVEAYKKVNGETIFANDLEMKDMQYAYGVSSKYAFAWVKNIDYHFRKSFLSFHIYPVFLP